MIKEITGIIFVIWGYLDGIKYWIEARKIHATKSSKGHSRKFINIALGNDLYRFFYFIFIDKNLYVLITTLVALVCMVYMFWEIYYWYPYRNRKKKKFRRPDIFSYFINSILPNRIRKRL